MSLLIARKQLHRYPLRRLRGYSAWYTSDAASTNLLFLGASAVHSRSCGAVRRGDAFCDHRKLDGAPMALNMSDHEPGELMASLRSGLPSSLDTIAGQPEHVYSIAEEATAHAGDSAVSSSWQRSANKYGLDPMDRKAPRILATAELKHFSEPLNKLIFSAQEEIDRLLKLVREAGYTVLLCDSSGVAVARRGEDARAKEVGISGEPGSAGCEPRRWRAQTALARTSSMSGLAPVHKSSTFPVRAR